MAVSSRSEPLRNRNRTVRAAQDPEPNRNRAELNRGNTMSDWSYDISRFYRLIQGMKCKKSSCNGVPVLRALKEVITSSVTDNLLLPNWLIHFLGQAPNVQGKNYFIGCTRWCAGEKFEHLYAPIPTSVNETILFQLINNDPITSNDIGQYEGPCFSFRHPRHGKQKKCSQ